MKPKTCLNFFSKTGNQKGFSLVEVVIVAAVVGIIALIAVNLLVDTHKHDIRLTVNQERRDLKDEISQIISRDGCGIYYLVDSNYTLLPKTEIQLQFPDDDAIVPLLPAGVSAGSVGGLVSPSLRVQSKLRYGSFEVQDVKLAPYVNYSTNPPTRSYVNLTSGSLGEKKAQLEIVVLDKTGSRTSSDPTAEAQIRTKVIAIPVVVVPEDGKLVNCYSLERWASRLEGCTGVGGVWDAEKQTCDLNVNGGGGEGSVNRCSAADRCAADPNFIISEINNK